MWYDTESFISQKINDSGKILYIPQSTDGSLVGEASAPTTTRYRKINIKRYKAYTVGGYDTHTVYATMEYTNGVNGNVTRIDRTSQSPITSTITLWWNPGSKKLSTIINTTFI